MEKEPPKTLWHWLGVAWPLNYAAAPWLGSFLGFLLLLVALALLLGAVLSLFYFVGLFFGLTVVAPENVHEAIRNVGLVLAAAFGAPFVAWRAMVAQRQVETAAAALFNDKVNAATEELAARKQVTKPVKDADGIDTILTEWHDDLVRRAAAIDRLEGLAQESPDDARRIARLLNTYVTELSRDYPPKPVPIDMNAVDWADATARDAARNALREWAWPLQVQRTDMERAVQTLTRLNTQIRGAEGANAPPVIVLEGANLQAMRLMGLDLQNADLSGAQIQEAKLSGAQMQGADLSGARFDAETNLTQATLDHAMAKNVDLAQSQFDPSQIAAMFGDASVALPPGLSRPAHWPDVDLRWNIYNETQSPYSIEYRAWRDHPDTYDWPARKALYRPGDDGTWVRKPTAADAPDDSA